MAYEFHTDEMLEAYLLGHLTEQRRAAMEDALGQDTALQQAVAAKKAELGILSATLLEAAGESDGSTLDPLVLAQYLDGSLSAPEKEQVETLLAGSPALQQQLITLYRESKVATDPTTVLETVEQRPTGSQVEFTAEEKQETRTDIPDVNSDEKPTEAAG